MLQSSSIQIFKKSRWNGCAKNFDVKTMTCFPAGHTGRRSSRRQRKRSPTRASPKVRRKRTAGPPLLVPLAPDTSFVSTIAGATNAPPETPTYTLASKRHTRSPPQHSALCCKHRRWVTSFLGRGPVIPIESNAVRWGARLRTVL